MNYSFQLEKLPEIFDFYTIARDKLFEVSSKFETLIFIHGGICEFTIEEKLYVAKKGSVIYIPSNVNYKRVSKNKNFCTMTYIYFNANNDVFSVNEEYIINSVIKNSIDCSLLNNIEFKSSKTPVIFLQNFMKPKNIDTVNKYLKEMMLLKDEGTLIASSKYIFNFCMLLSELSEQLSEKIIKSKNIKLPKTPVKMKKALSFIKNHLKSKISLDDLSNICGISKQQLTRYFKKEYNITPTQFIINYKINKATELLISTDLQIKEIALELGFEDQRYFSRMYKKITGNVPGDIRIKNK